MKLLISVSFFLLFLFSTVYSGTPDSSFFSTRFEKEVFNKVEKGEPVDTVDLFTALDKNDLNINDRVNSYIAGLKKKVLELPVNRRLKTIYNGVHEEFLRKYTEEAYFNDIFINGNYNCVTASALYALILEALGIEYMIKETPVHVYLIADPHNTSYLIESTLPGEKLVHFDDRLKSQYVDFLHNNKLISETEFNNSGTEELFEKHYLQDKTISLKQLAGLQYYNKGVFQYEKGKFGDAMVNFEKARLLNKHEMISYMLNNTLINLMEKENQIKSYNGHILAKYVNVNDSNSLGQQYARDFFGMVSSELVINRPNLPAYKKYFNDFSRNVGKVDVSEINRNFYFFLGYHHAVNYEYPQALANLRTAYELNTENILTRQLVIECIVKYLADELAFAWANDSLNSYITKFPFLKNDKNVVNLLGGSYLQSMMHSLYNEDYKTAFVILGKYESFLRENPDYRLEENEGASVYQQFAYYHMRTMQYDKAEQFLRKGIRIYPNNTILKDQLRSMKSMRGGSYEYPELMDDGNPLKKYLLAIAVAKDNLDVTNRNVESHLEQDWKGIAGKDSLSVNFAKDNRLIIRDHNGVSSGTWSYNNEKCLLTLTPEQKKYKVHLVITQLLPDRLRGIMYIGEDYRNSVDCYLKPQP